MLIKSLLTGAVLAGVAGGVVYFGTGGEIDEVQIQKSVSDMKAGSKNVTKKVTTTITETIDDLTGKATRKEVVEEEIIEETPSQTDKRVESAKADKKSEAPVAAKESVQDPKERKWLDRYLSDKSKKKSENQDDKSAEELPSREVDTPVTAQDINRPQPVNVEMKAPQNLGNNFEENYRMILDQVDNIQILDLKNRAYLSLVDYTVRERQFDRGLQIIPKISQVELRDTARSNIAVGLARANQSQTAFEVIDRVETQALSDVLRLQVIEAISYPVDANMAN